MQKMYVSHPTPWNYYEQVRRLSAVLSLIALVLLAPQASSDPADIAFKGPYDATLIGEKILYPSLFGVSAGLPVADVTGMQLSNGKLRAYVFAQNKGIEIAESSDGKTFVRVGNAFGGDKGYGMPHVVKLSDGRVRMYNMVSKGIACSISSDGLNFTLEKEVCINASDYSLAPNGLTGASIVKLKDGTYRAYFSDGVKAGTGPDPHNVFSATSTDFVTWKADSGVRVGPDASRLTRSAEHPGAIAHEDGTVTLFYYDNCAKAPKDSSGKWSCDPQAQGLWYATSTDNGLTFSTEERIMMPAPLPRDFGNDANVFMDKDGNLILWAGGFDHSLGGYIGSIRLTKRVEVVAPTPSPTPIATSTPSPTPSQTPSQTPSPAVASSPSPTEKVIAPLPTKAAAVKQTTITCIKGKTVKKITAVNPKCPTGYTKK